MRKELFPDSSNMFSDPFLKNKHRYPCTLKRCTWRRNSVRWSPNHWVLFTSGKVKGSKQSSVCEEAYALWEKLVTRKCQGISPIRSIIGVYIFFLLKLKLNLFSNIWVACKVEKIPLWQKLILEYQYCTEQSPSLLLYSMSCFLVKVTFPE